MAKGEAHEARFLDQCTIVKEGPALIVGNHSNDYSWGKLVLNYLLTRVLFNQKYQKILVICEGQKISELQLLLSIRQLSDDLLFCSSYGSELRETPKREPRIIFLRSWKQFSEIFLEQSTSLNFFSKDQSVAVFLYSLTDLLSGSFSTTAMSQSSYFEELLAFIRICTLNNLEESKRQSHLKSTSLGGVLRDCAILFVTHVEMSLVSIAQLSYWKSLFPTLIHAIPNYGTMSAEMAVQVQTVRRSVSTGKIQENVEMFLFKKRGVLLAPIMTKSILQSSEPYDGSNAVSSDAIKSNDSSSTLKDDPTEIRFQPSLQHGRKTPPKENPPQSTIPSTINARLITFDSEDPEFDEDSDPDADLDL